MGPPHLVLTPRAWAGLAVAAGLVWGFALRWRAVAAYEGPTGPDGYYYALQVRSLLEGRGLVYPSAPLALAWLAAWAKVLGLVPGIKVGACLATTLAGVPAYRLVRRATGSRGAGVAASALVAASVGSLQLTAVWIKQGFGLTVALGFLVMLARTRAAPRAGRVAVCGALLLLVALSHKAAVGLAMLLAVPVVARTRPARLAAAGALAVATLVAAHAGHLAPPPQAWSLVSVEAAAAAVAAVVFLFRGRSTTPEADVVRGAALFALALPCLRIDDLGYGPRLQVMAFVPLALCAPAALATVGMRGVAASRAAAQAALVTAAVMLLPPAWSRRAPIGPYPVEHCLPALTALPPNALLMTRDRGLMFAVRFRTGIDARLTEPAAAADRPRFRAVPLAVLPSEAATAPRAGRCPGFALLAEAEWRRQLAAAPEPRRRRLIEAAGVSQEH